MEGRAAVLISFRSPVEPKYFYCCRSQTNKLLRTNLLTGAEFSLQVPGFMFKACCSWSELSGGRLLVTGGDPNVNEVVEIDTLREYAVSSQPPMHTARGNHAAVYHSQCLYVLGGYTYTYLRECERYVCAESRWEELPALPLAGFGMSAVELGNSLYALGGRGDEGDLDAVQKLRLDSLTWQLMQLKLPQKVVCFPCFKTDSKVYLVINGYLYSFSPLQVKPIKRVGGSISTETSYYSRGTLYFTMYGGIIRLAVGDLTNL
jgi:hypothetical protein